MQKMLLALSLAAGLGLACMPSAGAVPADAVAVKEAATAASPLQDKHNMPSAGRGAAAS